MKANTLKNLLKVGTIVAGTAASFLLASCWNVEEEPDEMIEGECEVSDTPEETSKPTE